MKLSDLIWWRSVWFRWVILLNLKNLFMMRHSPLGRCNMKCKIMREWKLCLVAKIFVNNVKFIFRIWFIFLKFTFQRIMVWFPLWEFAESWCVRKHFGLLPWIQILEAVSRFHFSITFYATILNCIFICIHYLICMINVF